jgi:peptide subunit release factor 1 (eRF1)
LLELVADISVERQLGVGNELVAAVMSGAGENVARGRQAVDGALQQGRVDTLVMHEDVAGHWGRAGDSRHHQPPWDDAPYEAMLRQARASSAEIMFCQAPELIEQHQGVAARLRW